MSSQPPVQLIIRFQGNEESLDVADAFAQRPKDVRDAILDAVRLTKPPKNDINLLAIESNFWYSLEKVEEKWGEPRVFRSVLDACRQGCLKDKTEGLFYDLGGAADVIALAVATVRDKNTLHRPIDALPVEELRRLIGHVHKIPKGAVIDELAARYMRSEPGHVSNPPPQLTRPRFHGTRVKGHATARQPSDPQSPGRSKKRRFAPEIAPEALCQSRHPHLPPLNTISLSTARQPSQTLPPLRQLPIQPVFSSGQYQGTRASQLSGCIAQNANNGRQYEQSGTELDLLQPHTEAVFPKYTQDPSKDLYIQSKTGSHSQAMSQPETDLFSLQHHGPRDVFSNAKSAVKGYSPVEKQDQHHNTGLDSLKQPKTIRQDTILPKSTGYSPNGALRQSNSDPPPRKMGHEVSIPFAEIRPELACDDFGAYLQGGPMALDVDFGGYLQDGPMALDVDFGVYLQDGPMALDVDFGGYLQDGPMALDVGTNDSTFNLEEAQGQSELGYSNDVTEYAQGVHPCRDTRGVIGISVE